MLQIVESIIVLIGITVTTIQLQSNNTLFLHIEENMFPK